jgi:predicted nucleic acid-binding protein
VPNFFLDTSALAKLYHRELGSDVMERILGRQGSRCLISRLSIVEMESVLAIKARSHQLDNPGMETARRRLRADIAQHRIIVASPIDDAHFQTARRLLATYGVIEGLRTLDALQLSIALGLRNAELIDAMVAADRRLCRVAELAGCPAIDPQVPGPLVTA